MSGTFTPVNGQNNQPTGTREAYRFCLVLADLKTGKVVAKSVARAQLAGVDGTPTTVFRQSPVWTADPATQAYISTCRKCGPEYKLLHNNCQKFGRLLMTALGASHSRELFHP